jgi:carboxyl-terminal processing protease
VQQLVDLDQFLLSPRTASRGEVKKPGVGFEEKERYGQSKLTTEKFYRITGNSTQRKGVMPDINLPSPFNVDEMGESSQPTALPYDEVEKSNFVKVNNITDKLVGKIRSRYDARLKTDEDLKELVSDLEDYKVLKDKNVYSLNYDVRKKEKEETEQKRKSLKKINKSGSKEGKDDEDILLIESQRILADMIGAGK